jgi:hypothetical protein
MSTIGYEGNNIIYDNFDMFDCERDNSIYDKFHMFDYIHHRYERDKLNFHNMSMRDLYERSNKNFYKLSMFGHERDSRSIRKICIGRERNNIFFYTMCMMLSQRNSQDSSL